MSTNKRRGVRRVVPNIAKARVVKQTQFDRQLVRIEQLVQKFHELIEQPQQSPEDREAIQINLWNIRLRHLYEAVHSLEWAMKKAQMQAFPLGANGP